MQAEVRFAFSFARYRKHDILDSRHHRTCEDNPHRKRHGGAEHARVIDYHWRLFYGCSVHGVYHVPHARTVSSIGPLWHPSTLCKSSPHSLYTERTR